jgi:hypothetical protein
VSLGKAVCLSSPRTGPDTGNTLLTLLEQSDSAVSGDSWEEMSLGEENFRVLTDVGP